MKSAQRVNIGQLPTLPHILLKLISLSRQEEAGLGKLAPYVTKDPALSAKILKLVNSAHFGLSHRIRNINQAVTLAGSKAVVNIAITSAIYETFKPRHNSSGFNLKYFWWHSLKCAILARRIARKENYQDFEGAFLAGLLHDIGKMVLWMNTSEGDTDMAPEPRNLVYPLSEDDIPSPPAHQDIGASLMGEWHLHSYLADAVRYHHEPENRISSASLLVKIIFIANLLSHSDEKSLQEGESAAVSFLNYDQNDLKAILKSSDREMAETAELLGIDIEAPAPETASVSEADDEKYAALSNEVRNNALLIGTLQRLLSADTEKEILTAAKEGFHQLFNTKDALFFSYDQESESLVCLEERNDDDEHSRSELVIPLNTKESVMVRALLENRILDSYHRRSNAPIPIIDEQVKHYLDAGEMLCLPLVKMGEPLGVLAVGLDETQHTRIPQQIDIMTLFAQQAAAALHTHMLMEKRMEEIRQERFQAAAAMSRKVIHEINNPLNIIKNYLKLLEERFAEENKDGNEVQIIREELERVSELLNEFSSFSQKKYPMEDRVNVNHVLEDIVRIVEAYARKALGIQFLLNLDPAIGEIRSNKNGLKQIFINLIKNAVEAMEEGGTLEIVTRRTQPAPKSPEMLGPVESTLEIVIKDNGPGIPEAIRHKLFDPYVGSKGGSHSGLGLSIVRNILHELNGRIKCDSRPAEGTTFVITIPA